MAKQRQDSRLFNLAKREAQAQLNDLMHEVKMLLELFPHLRDNFNKDEMPISFLLKEGSQKALRGKKPTLSAAARKRTSVGQKRRRTKRKASEKTK